MMKKLTHLRRVTEINVSLYLFDCQVSIDSILSCFWSNKKMIHVINIKYTMNMNYGNIHCRLRNVDTVSTRAFL